MEREKKIDTFFILNGFKLKFSDISESFGDYYKVYSNGEIMFRLSASKSFEMIDVSKDGMNWYDLGLIKSFILKEKILTNTLTEKLQEIFLVTYFCKVCELFENTAYLDTQKELEKLENIRMKQMFF